MGCDMTITIDKYLAETIISTFGKIDKVCLAIDRYLLNVGSYPSVCDDSITILYNNLTQQIIRKSKLIRFKSLVLSCVKALKMRDRQIFEVLTKLKNTKKEDVCILLDITERTFFRRIENLYKNLAESIRCSRESQFVLDVCENEHFIYSNYEPIKKRRQSYKNGKDSSCEKEV